MIEGHSFRGLSAAAPLKPDEIVALMIEGHSFRGLSAAAPLKLWGARMADESIIPSAASAPRPH